MPDNPLAPLSVVMKRLAEEAQKDGLQLVGFAVTPNYDPDGPHTCQGVFRPIPDWNKDEPQVEDPEFEDFIKAQERFEAEQKADEARQQLQSLRDDLKDPSSGLGLDD